MSPYIVDKGTPVLVGKNGSKLREFTTKKRTTFTEAERVGCPEPRALTHTRFVRGPWVMEVEESWVLPVSEKEGDNSHGA